METNRTRRRPGRAVPALLAALALALAACAGDYDDASGDSATDDGGAPSFDEAADHDVTAEDVGGGANGEGAGPSSDADLADRAVIRTASMHIEVRDSAAAAEEIADIVREAGGYVAGTDLARNAEGVVAGTFTLRVPSAALEETLDELDALADAVPERRLDETDVTTELTDLDAEITNLTAYEEELRALLGEVRESTTDTEELLQVFDRVNDVRARIDQATARRAMLEDQVAMSTIELRLSPTSATGPVTDPGWDPGGTARSALASTMRTLTGIADAAIRLGLTVLPVTLVLLAPAALLAFAARWWWRRSQRPAAAAPTSPGSDGTAAEGSTDQGPPTV